MSLSLSTQSHTTLSLNHMAMEASPVVTDTDTAENLEVTDMEANLAREARVEDTITLSHLGLRHLDRSLSRSHIIPLDTGSMSQDLIQNQSQLCTSLNPCLNRTARVVRVDTDTVERVVDMDTDTVNMEVIMVTDTAARVVRVATAVVMEAREASRVVDVTSLCHQRPSPSLNQEVGLTSLSTLLTQIMNGIIPFPNQSLCPSLNLNLNLSQNLSQNLYTMASLERDPRDMDTDMERDITDTDMTDTDTVASLAREARVEDITLALALSLSHLHHLRRSLNR